ncbi:MAG: CorA family divalent cation transporter [Saprospiraceae bacterium]|jgi:magnesium transporter|nr:CorA family divalent cation transporter [Saprospiraceae bacterium]
MITKYELPQETGCTWIDIEHPEMDELEKLSQEFNLHQYTVRDCLEPDHLPKFEVLDDFNFVIIRVFAAEIDDRGHTAQDLTNKIAIFFNDKVLITIHRRSFDFIAEIYNKYIPTLKIHTISEIFSKILWYGLHSYEKPAQLISNEIDDIESSIFLHSIHPQQLEHIYFLKRKASICKKMLLQTTDILSRHHSTKNDKIVIQDIKDLHLRLITLFDQAQEDAHNLSNVYISLSAQKTNDVMKLLTVFSVFFMPLTFIAGIYGMNFENMPELRAHYGYHITIASMLVISIIIFVWFKRRKLI